MSEGEGGKEGSWRSPHGCGGAYRVIRKSYVCTMRAQVCFPLLRWMRAHVRGCLPDHHDAPGVAYKDCNRTGLLHRHRARARSISVLILYVEAVCVLVACLNNTIAIWFMTNGG